MCTHIPVARAPVCQLPLLSLVLALMSASGPVGSVWRPLPAMRLRPPHHVAAVPGVRDDVMNLPTLRQILQSLPFWLIQMGWILLLVGALAAAAYLFWYLADRNERGRKALRGFAPDQNRRS